MGQEPYLGEHLSWIESPEAAVRTMFTIILYQQINSKIQDNINTYP